MLRTIFPLAAIFTLLAGPAGAQETQRQASDACLVCHDGSAATRITGEDCHPCQVEYQMTRPARFTSLRPRTAQSGFGSTVEEDLLVNGRVECTSCHVDHDQPTDAPDRLRMVDGRLQSLCLGCHVLNGS